MKRVFHGPCEGFFMVAVVCALWPLVIYILWSERTASVWNFLDNFLDHFRGAKR